MTSSNRARTRAVRAEMARTGENYTRSAAAIGKTSSKSVAGSLTDAVREHLRRVLAAQLHDGNARLQRAEELERSGRRIVAGGQVSDDGWEIRDWRTGEMIAEGTDGFAGYEAAADDLDPDGTWFHCDHLWGEELTEVTTPGVPPSLGTCLEDWIGQVSTPDEEIAELVGWTIEKVRQHR